MLSMVSAYQQCAGCFVNLYHNNPDTDRKPACQK